MSRKFMFVVNSSKINCKSGLSSFIILYKSWTVSAIYEKVCSETENRKRLHAQIYLAKELQNSYMNLISQEQPCACTIFRTKVNENNPPYELPIHRQATTDLDNKNRKLGHKKKKRNWFRRLNSGHKNRNKTLK